MIPYLHEKIQEIRWSRFLENRLTNYSLVLNKRPPRLLIFRNFSHPPGPYLDPPAY